jgi:hypothetical protein
MARVNQLWNDRGTDKAGSSGNEDTHILFSFWLDQSAYPAILTSRH